MDSAVEVDRRLRSLATATPEMNTEDVAALCRVANAEDLRVGRERALQVVEEGDVVCVRVVRVEPRQAWDSLSGHACEQSDRDQQRCFRINLGPKLTRTLIGTKSTLRRNISAKILRQDGSLKAKSLESLNLSGRDGDIEVLVGVQVEGHRRKGSKLGLDGIALVMGRDAEGLVSAIRDLPLLGHGRGQHKGGQGGDGGERELHLDGGMECGISMAGPESNWIVEDHPDIYVHRHEPVPCARVYDVIRALPQHLQAQHRHMRSTASHATPATARGRCTDVGGAIGEAALAQPNVQAMAVHRGWRRCWLHPVRRQRGREGCDAKTYCRQDQGQLPYRGREEPNLIVHPTVPA